MSQTEEQVDTERALEFFRIFSAYLARQPKTAIWALHAVTTDLNHVIRSGDQISHDLHYYLGRIEGIEKLLWVRDSSKVVLDALSNSQAVSDLLRAITFLAKAYILITDNNNAGPAFVIDSLDKASDKLFDILRDIIDNTEKKVKESSPA
jgi:hypothetical protein